MKNPLFQIILWILFFWWVAAIVLWMVTPEISIYWALLVFPIAATIGPFMGIGFFPFFFYGVAVLLSAVTVLMGLLKANGFLGRVICLLGAVCWTLLGLLGLGTGS